MREVEIKVWADDFDRIKGYFDSVAGCGHPVNKEDYYFRRPGETVQALRIRNNNGVLEITTKKNSKNERGEENNYEYEFESPLDQLEKAKDFFFCLGYEHYFDKIKNGFDWSYKGIHVELLDVKNVGVFLEMEALIPFDADDELVQKNVAVLYSILDEVGLSRDRIEKRSYRSLILKGV
ncbi:MAG: class IV adenylate cyclase [Spirochaetales bacterium]|nr:class IV adenylate cyclase [Spirochaetales bacterium]